MHTTRLQLIEGCLLGCAVGDAIGLPYEGMSTRRARRFARLPLEQRFLLGYGMVSDDTDHSVFVAQAMLRGGGDVEKFRACLAWRFRLWFLCLPAGIGLATLRGILRLWLGMRRSGVFSAGNGPSMRSAIIGATWSHDTKRRRAHVHASTLLTHTDPKAFVGALAVAEVAAQLVAGLWKQKPDVETFMALLASVSADTSWQKVVDGMRAACTSPDPMGFALKQFGTRQGISGYVLHSVPFALLAWYHHFGDYRATIETITQAGGDVDTVAAIAGALAGATSGTDGIPQTWLKHLTDWPHSTGYMRELATGLAACDSPQPNSPEQEPPAVNTRFSPWLFPRGILFTTVVLLHGLRRLLPPY
ncbi:MAG: ADP-ribosylglycohydrolase family protein [Rhodoferax sp.]|nr:ADP-ribosylglycohydrolase family protein [Rhodoferax sp.]